MIDGLKAGSEALPRSNPWTILNFLAQPDDRLRGRKPIDTLREGKIELVVPAARRMASRPAWGSFSRSILLKRYHLGAMVLPRYGAARRVDARHHIYFTIVV